MSENTRNVMLGLVVVLLALYGVGALVDAAAARRLGPDPEASPRWSGVAARFRTATRLEADFWAMGLAVA